MSEHNAENDATTTGHAWEDGRCVTCDAPEGRPWAEPCPTVEFEALTLLLRRAARTHLALGDGDYWPSDVADAQARAAISGGWTRVTPPVTTHLMTMPHDGHEVTADCPACRITPAAKQRETSA